MFILQISYMFIILFQPIIKKKFLVILSISTGDSFLIFLLCV